MYKPDPRLPPEQQLLPTHAKRLQQEQWETARKESEARQRARGDKPGNGAQATTGEGANAFTPLAVHTRNGLQPSPQQNGLDAPPSPLDRQQQQDATGERSTPDGWPLTKPPEPNGKYSPQSPPMRGHSVSPVSPISAAATEKMNGGFSTGPPPRMGKSPEQQERTDKGQGVVVDPFEKERLARQAEEREERGEKG